MVDRTATARLYAELEDLRNSINYTVEEMAELMCVCPSTYWRIRHGSGAKARYYLERARGKMHKAVPKPSKCRFGKKPSSGYRGVYRHSYDEVWYIVYAGRYYGRYRTVKAAVAALPEPLRRMNGLEAL